MSFTYYDVASGETRTVEHGALCVCGECVTLRLRSALKDIISSHKAFAPSVKRRSGVHRLGPTVTSSFSESPDWWESVPKEPVYQDEGKCFGWDVDLLDVEVYMHLNDKPLSPDMTKQETAVMSVDQAKAVITLKVLYNPFFNERLKSTIEPKYRNWNPANKCWEFHPSMMKQVQQVCNQFYKCVQIIGQKPILGTKFEKLLSQLTKEDKVAIYRLMALKYHPDKGGSHETMSLLNEVFKQ